MADQVVPETVPKRRPGRPKGLPKTGGRRRGTPNKDRAATLEAIRTYSDPIGFLEKVCRGLLVECRDADGEGQNATALTRPSMEQRITAATILAKKVLPDVKAVELEVTDGTLTIRVNKYPFGPDKQDATPPGDDGGTIRGGEEISPPSTQEKDKNDGEG